ncbi:MAG TPA: methyltransferase domain-containing protein [Candidatus Tectomicrobia bacterium]
MPTEHPNVVLSRQHFDLMADQYDEMFITHMHDYDITHEMVLSMLPFPREGALRVLELGTGTGNLTQKLLDRFPQSTVVGYDVSTEMLARARAKLASVRARVQLHQGDISHITFPGPFDAVISAIAVHHVPPPAKPVLFHRLYTALRPGGVLVIGDAFQPATPALGERYRQLTAAEFERDGVVETPAYVEYRSRNSQPSGGASTQLHKYLQWMQQAGLSNVDCVWKHFARAVVYGERPVEA